MMSALPNNNPVSEPLVNESAKNPTWCVLFVDDDVDFLDAQAAFFGCRGHKVLTARDSAEALAILEQTTPDIIFLDLMMEHYDSGFRLAYEIRRRKVLTHVPLVMLSGVAATTGHRFAHEEQNLREWSHLDRFLDKPVTGKQLLDLAAELLADRNTNDTGRPTAEGR